MLLSGSSTGLHEHNAPRGSLLRGADEAAGAEQNLCSWRIPGGNMLVPLPQLSLWQRPRNTQAASHCVSPHCPSPRLTSPSIENLLNFPSQLSPRDQQAACSLLHTVSGPIPSGSACLIEHEPYFSSELTEWTRGNKKVCYTSLPDRSTSLQPRCFCCSGSGNHHFFPGKFS